MHAYTQRTQIEAAYRHGTSKITIEGTEVVPFPLFRVLDGTNTEDYLQRVEPSPQGGKKMADALLAAVLASEALPTPATMPRPATMER